MIFPLDFASTESDDFHSFILEIGQSADDEQQHATPKSWRRRYVRGVQVHMVVCFAWIVPHSDSQMDCVISNFHDYLIRWWVVTWWPVKHKIAVCESMKRKIRDTINASESTELKWTLFPCQMYGTQSNSNGWWCILHIVQWALQGVHCVRAMYVVRSCHCTPYSFQVTKHRPTDTILHLSAFWSMHCVLHASADFR